MLETNKFGNHGPAVYIHIPFCEHICYYCDFNKVFIEGQPVDEYVDLLVSEIALKMKHSTEKNIETIYVGGGTPTTLTPKQLERLLIGIREHLPYQAGEFTFEANPNDLLDNSKLEVLREYGVNRLSMGVQSFNDDILKRIGRVHRSADVYTAIENARQTGFDNISIDLIYRLPGQDVADFEKSLDQAIALDLPHYSTYSLILEKKTIFYNLMRQGKLFLPTEDAEADMYQLAIDKMQAAGKMQYEISNFAKPGFESKHNMKYWQNDKYYGFGAGAHGYLQTDRYQNNGPIQQYLEPLREGKLPIFAEHILPIEEQMEEQLFLGLRMMKGISIDEFEQRFERSLRSVYGETIEILEQQGLLEQIGNRLRLTSRGKFLGNEVFQAFLLSD